MKLVSWGLIGTGDVTEVKSGPALYKARNSRLVAVTNRTLAKAESWVARHGAGKVYPDVASLLAVPEVDIVYIATPPGDHLSLTLQAAAAGKHVYVEKPMARNQDECRQMIAACQAAKVRLFVAYYRRSLPRFAQVKAWLEQGLIGTVCSVQVVQHAPPSEAERDPATLPWRLQAEHSGGGKFLDVAVHALDILDWWFGPIVQVDGQAANRGGLYSVEDTVSASWRHAKGCVGHGEWCFVSRDSADRITITGTTGTIDLECFSDSPVRLTTAQGCQEPDIRNPPHIQQPHIQSIVDELGGTGLCPSDPQSAARTSAVADRILASYHQAHKPD